MDLTIGINVFHIIFVASLLCLLGKNLNPGNDILYYVTFITVGIMVIRHSFITYGKIYYG
jgi:hypothetical protein